MTGVTPSGPGHSPSGLSQSPLSQAEPSVPNALPIIAKLHEQVGTGHYYDDGFAMVGSDGSFESRPSTQAMRPANRDGSEAAHLIAQLYEALDQLLHAIHPATQRVAAEKARKILAKARGNQ